MEQISKGEIQLVDFEIAEKSKKGETFWTEAKKLLGARLNHMVYVKPNNNYAADALVNSEGTLPVRVAIALMRFLPTCSYTESSKQIVCEDVPSISLIPFDLKTRHEGRDFYVEEEQEKVKIHQDSRYLIAVADSPKKISMYFYRK